jgi:hypothetical protein
MYQLLKLLGNDIHAEEETKLQLVERRLKVKSEVWVR